MRGVRCKSLMTGALAALVLGGAIAGCSRPLTTNEREVAKAVFGDSFDPDPVRVHMGIGLTPLPSRAPSDGKAARRAAARAASDGATEKTSSKSVRQAIPDDACDRVAVPNRGWRPPAGFALGNQLFLAREAYRPDMFAGWPVALPIGQSLLMAHEMVHVWQYQNRDITGYTPLKSGAESFRPDDPYFWADKGQSALLAFNYEAQATIIEDYLCYTFLLPDHPKRAELAALIGPILPVARNFGP